MPNRMSHKVRSGSANLIKAAVCTAMSAPMRARMNLDNVRCSLAYVGHGSKITAVYRLVQKKGTVLLSTSLACRNFLATLLPFFCSTLYNVRATLAERASELCQPGVPFVGSHCLGFIHECIGPGHCAAGALWLPEKVHMRCLLRS